MAEENRELRMDQLMSVSGGDLGGLSCLVRLAATILEGAKASAGTSTTKPTLGATYGPIDVGQTRTADRLR
jgi:hypothetical protein